MSVTVLQSLLFVTKHVLFKHVSEASSIVKNTVCGFASYLALWKAAMQAMQSWFKTSISIIAWPTFSRYPCITGFRMSLKFQTTSFHSIFQKGKVYRVSHASFWICIWSVTWQVIHSSKLSPKANSSGFSTKCVSICISMSHPKCTAL